MLRCFFATLSFQGLVGDKHGYVGEDLGLAYIFFEVDIRILDCLFKKDVLSKTGLIHLLVMSTFVDPIYILVVILFEQKPCCRGQTRCTCVFAFLKLGDG